MKIMPSHSDSHLNVQDLSFHTSWMIAEENPSLHSKIFNISFTCCLLKVSGTTSTALWNYREEKNKCIEESGWWMKLFENVENSSTVSLEVSRSLSMEPTNAFSKVMCLFKWELMRVSFEWGTRVEKTLMQTIYTRKIAQVVTSMQTSCYKSVHKLSTNCVRTTCSQLL
jgi:hypothetical protein